MYLAHADQVLSLGGRQAQHLDVALHLFDVQQRHARRVWRAREERRGHFVDLYVGALMAERAGQPASERGWEREGRAVMVRSW